MPSHSLSIATQGHQSKKHSKAQRPMERVLHPDTELCVYLLCAPVFSECLPQFPRPPSQGTLPYLMKSMFSSRRRLTCLLCTSLFKKTEANLDFYHSLFLPHGRQLKPERTEGTHIHSEHVSLFHCDQAKGPLWPSRDQGHINGDYCSHF